MGDDAQKSPTQRNLCSRPPVQPSCKLAIRDRTGGQLHFKTDVDLTSINVTNKYALYNLLSTFSGTHYVTPRAMTAKVTLNF